MNEIRYCRPVAYLASFIAASTASVPEFVRNTLVGDIGAISAIRAQVSE